LGVKLWNEVKVLRLTWVAEAYATFETEWRVRDVVERGTNAAKPCNAMERKKGHVPQANSHRNMLCPAPIKGGGALTVVLGLTCRMGKRNYTAFKSKVCGGGTEPQCLRGVLRFMTVKE